MTPLPFHIFDVKFECWKWNYRQKPHIFREIICKRLQKMYKMPALVRWNLSTFVINVPRLYKFIWVCLLNPFLGPTISLCNEDIMDDHWQGANWFQVRNLWFYHCSADSVRTIIRMHLKKILHLDKVSCYMEKKLLGSPFQNFHDYSVVNQNSASSHRKLPVSGSSWKMIEMVNMTVSTRNSVL